MKYVDDLSKVKPEEITTVDGESVISITRIPDPCSPVYEFVVCTEKAFNSFNIEGRFTTNADQQFIYKPEKYTKDVWMKKISPTSEKGNTTWLQDVVMEQSMSPPYEKCPGFEGYKLYRVTIEEVDGE